MAGNTETVTVVRPTGKDSFGDPLPGTATEFDLPGCLFAPGASQETPPGEPANQVDTHATIYAPPAADVRASDQIRARGVLYEVVGEPAVWSGFGTVIELRRVTG